MHAPPAPGAPPRPPGRPSVRMRWLDLLFVHWPVPVEVVRPLVPDALELDVWDGAAWVGLVPFSMEFRLRGLPPVPTMHRFPECNVRTYVTHEDVPGVWFFSLDATSRLAVWGARRRWHLNYVHARIRSERTGPRLGYTLQRVADPATRLRCTWRMDMPRPAARPGELAHFLTERYALYTIDARGRVCRGRIQHAPWPLREATLEHLEDDLVAAAGLAVDTSVAPLVYHADAIVVDAWPLERC